MGRRRGTVLIMVVGLLAMLFIIGSTLLIVARAERRTADKLAGNKLIEAVSRAVTEPVINQLREGVVGNDGQPYNAPWNNSDTSLAESWEVFPGFPANISSNQDVRRTGNLLLSSAFPYWDGDEFRLRWASWPLSTVSEDAAGALGYFVDVPVALRSATDLASGRDATGDGIYDSPDSSMLASLARMFGGDYRVDLRVVGHGGMVLLDPMTHPSLLAQVIHPSDTSYADDPLSLWTGADPLDVSDPAQRSLYEHRLRRRMMLPVNLGVGQTYADLDASDVRSKLPYTLGYAAPSGLANGDELTPHWWMPDASLEEGEEQWAEARLTTPPALTETAAPLYSADDDALDRRHMLTLYNSDDILRRQREESRLLYNQLNQSPTYDDPLLRYFYYVLNPSHTQEWDSLFEGIHNIAMQPAEAYGVVDGDLQFNVPGLRTQFSLRDVLEPIPDPKGFHVSYRKAVQLTAYYLAMIQRTSVPGTNADQPTIPELLTQLETAAQLAVNTLDYADADQVSTYFAWPPNVPPDQAMVQVFGVEKQPYLTEAYAKQVYTAMPDGLSFKWNPDLSIESLYAVELYNPYPQPLDLNGFRLISSGPPIDLNMVIPAFSYIVIANRIDDPQLGSPPGTPFIQGALIPVVENQNLFTATELNIQDGSVPTLELTNSRIVRLAPAGNIYPAIDDFGAPITFNELDQLNPDNGPWSPNRWAEPVVSPDDLGSYPDKPEDLEDRLVRDTSLQRHKEWIQYGAAPDIFFPPNHWNFTIAWQGQFPLVQWETVLGDGGEDPPIGVDKDRPPQHSLLGTDPMAAITGIGNQGLLRRVFKGEELIDYLPFGPIYSSITLTISGNDPVAQVPIVLSDAGVSQMTGGTLAFPTTGSLLFVPRYAHKKKMVPIPLPDGYDDINHRYTYEYSHQAGASTQAAGTVEQLRLLDNGHLPIFNPCSYLPPAICMALPMQSCTDLQNLQGRLGSDADPYPWGRLVYDYFTALPLGELAWPYTAPQWQAMSNALGLPMPTNVPPEPAGRSLLDASAEGLAEFATNEDLFRAYYNGLFFGYPYQSPETAAPSPLGPRVEGRININLAPWWVLDGLPALNNAMQFSEQAIPDYPLTLQSLWKTENPPASNYYPFAPMTGVPVPEILRGSLDPQAVAFTNIHEQAGDLFLSMLFDDMDDAPTPPLNASTVSPTLARYMVSYREMRGVDGVDAWAGYTNAQPGFLSVGQMADLVARVRLPEVETRDEEGVATTLENQRLVDLRNHPARDDPSDVMAYKPYAYLGYLQLAAPLVRLQDWVTVKNHVYTIYATVGDRTDPPTWMRNQVTVDRTQCLYSTELPRRITETPPTGYYDSINDQR